MTRIVATAMLLLSTLLLTAAPAHASTEGADAAPAQLTDRGITFLYLGTTPARSHPQPRAAVQRGTRYATYCAANRWYGSAFGYLNQSCYQRLQWYLCAGSYEWRLKGWALAPVNEFGRHSGAAWSCVRFR